jgi:hypothetical protein
VSEFRLNVYAAPCAVPADETIADDTTTDGRHTRTEEVEEGTESGPNGVHGKDYGAGAAVEQEQRSCRQRWIVSDGLEEGSELGHSIRIKPGPRSVCSIVHRRLINKPGPSADLHIREIAQRLYEHVRQTPRYRTSGRTGSRVVPNTRSPR